MRAELAYLLGAYLSDGHLLWGHCKDPHPIWGIDDESFANCISIALSKIGSPCSLRRRRGRFHVRELAGGQLGRWFWKVSGEKERLPKISRELIRPLVAGLMDGDGYASVKHRDASSRQIAVGYDGSKPFIWDFFSILGALGVEGSIRQRTHCVFRKRMNVEDFLAAGLNFAMPRKQARLALWCCQVQRAALSRGHDSDYQRAEVAKWWMREVYSRDLLVPIPTGRYTF